MLSSLTTIICPSKIDISSHMYHMHIVTMRYYHWIIKKFKSIPYRNQIPQAWEFFPWSFYPFLQSIGIGLPCGLTTLPYTRPFFLQFFLHTNKQIVISHAHYITFAHLHWLPNNLQKFVHTNNHIHLLKKENDIPYTFITLSYQASQNAIKNQMNLINVPMSMATFTDNAPLHWFSDHYFSY